ncbi:dipeptidase [Haliangium sp.]|uniref:dipeptidase n=1 Tax=Haliangium sp. TaxID=2663208 RepID=UPI003D10D69F
MARRSLVRTVGLALLLLVVVGAALFFSFAAIIADRLVNPVAEVAEAPASRAQAQAAQALHSQLVIADLHADALLWPRDLLRRYDRGHVDVPRLAEGNVAVQVFGAVTHSPWGQNVHRNQSSGNRVTVLVVAQRWPLTTWTSLEARALYQAERLHQTAERSDGLLTVIHSAAELDAFLARREREREPEPSPVAGLLAIEGMHAIEGDLAKLDELFEAGYRMMGLAHFIDNELAGSAHGVNKGGLTELGRAAVRRMEELGVVVDLAHAAPRTIDDVLAMSTRPVVVSHTGVRATCDNPRNLADEHIRGIAAGGGVIGIGYWDGAVCGLTPDAIATAIAHVRDLVGVAHVGLGSDFDGAVRTGLDTTGLVGITAALKARGFSDDDVRAVMGGNVIRLLRQGLPPK